MTNYKIVNMTKGMNKRDPMFNSTLTITYVDSMIEKKINIKPDEIVYLSINSLPLSIQKLRVKKLISVYEISDTELKNAMLPQKPKKAMPVEAVVEKKEEIKKKPIKKGH